MTPTSLDPRTESLLRELTPQVLGVVVRRFREFDAAEDAVQEALIAAAVHWPRDGVPENPIGWLIHVAFRRIADHVRSESSRRRREAIVFGLVPVEQVTPDADDRPVIDDTLVLLFMCCHPSLSTSSAVALTLRAVGGLTTHEIAHAFLVPEATMAQRISRAKQSIKTSNVPFAMPTVDEQAERLDAVLHVLYLIFNEGYASSVGPDLQRRDLANEAIRLTRIVHGLLPEHAETTGLLALMLLTDARRLARTAPNGALISLSVQDRSRWDAGAIAEGVALLSEALPRGEVGAYQLQAAIAAVHDEAVRVEDTDWPQILALYDLLERVNDSPMVTLNRAVAVAMVHGPRAGLVILDSLERDARLEGHHRLYAVRAHLLEKDGDSIAAIEQFRRAADRTTSLPERNYLLLQAARLSDGGS